jgi:hypothetical protein
VGNIAAGLTRKGLDGCSPSVVMSLRAANEERMQWEIACAKGLYQLAVPLAER